jgi:uncharacterized delta-60 repeat protein
MILKSFKSFRTLVLFLLVHLTTLAQGGAMDPAFNTGTGFNGYVDEIAVRDDGTLIIVGAFTEYNSVSVNGIVCLNADGTANSSFDGGTGFYHSSGNFGVNSLCLQPDGKMIVAGNFTSYQGVSANGIIRLNEDGSVDSTFDSGTGFNGLPVTAVLQPDGKIILVGQFAEYNGSSAYNIIRLNGDGAADASFASGQGFLNNLWSTIALEAVVQTDGKIIVGGSFDLYNGTSVNNVIRLNSNGTIDNGFSIGTGIEGAVRCITLRPDGKIFLAGEFFSYNSVVANSLVLLNDDGTVDATFNVGAGIDAATETINAVTLQTDGKILIGGRFSQFNGISKQGMIRLNQDGSDDTTFTIGSGFDELVSSIIIQSDCKILASGDYQNYNNNTVNRIVRLLSDIPTSTIFVLPSDEMNCNGELAIQTIGRADFTAAIDSNILFTYSNYHLEQNLCPGVHTLSVTDVCGNAVTGTFIIPVDSNYIFNNPFIDSIAVDSLGATIEDCDIYYNSIDTAFIDSIFANGNTVTVIWNIVDSNGSNFDTSTYVLNNGNGVYYLQLSVFCPTKSIGDYFAVTEAIYFEDGNISTADLTVLDDDLFELFPNPTSDIVTMRFEAPKADLAIVDAQGKRIQTQTIISGDSISLAHLETGVYFFELITEQGKTTRRLVKQ